MLKKSSQLKFQQELYNLLDEDSDDDDNGMCQITGLPLLKDTSVTLECKHHFNYEALYTEIYTQKYEHKSYCYELLTPKGKQDFRKSKLDYFIKCPYCRNIQFNILPYYEELGLEKVYGINSLADNLPNTIRLVNPANIIQKSNHSIEKFEFNMYDTTFKFGECCKKINAFGDNCPDIYVAPIPNTKLSYCKKHYNFYLTKYKLAEKKKLVDAKIAEKSIIMNERQKLFEEKNAERLKKGLPMLKRLPPLSKANIVEQPTQTIQAYVPEEAFKEEFKEEKITGCNAIIKSGLNKGKHCGCKNINAEGLCKRHIPKIKEI